MTAADHRDPRWVDQVLAFWFEELAPSDWFQVNSAVDEAIRARFLDLYDVLSTTLPGHMLTSARQALAAIVVLDQFPRNLFRGTARAFATDNLARLIAERAIEKGYDSALNVAQRQFMYLPFEHSEDPQDQERAVALISRLGDETATKFAVAHKKIIDRFGRFPHRNAALSRNSTPEELAFLKEPGSSF